MTANFVEGPLSASALNGAFANHVDCRGGDVMEGPFFLWDGDGSALGPDGTDYLQGACRGWVREQLAEWPGPDYLPITGGTVTGPLTLMGDLILDTYSPYIRGNPDGYLGIQFWGMDISTYAVFGGSSSGPINIYTGQVSVGGFSGAIWLQTGMVETGIAGNVEIQPGPATLGGSGGSVRIIAGSADQAGGIGGNVFISPGQGTNGAADGIVRVVGTTQFVSAHSPLPGFAEINVDDDGTGLWSSFVTGDTGANIWIATGLVSGYGTVASGQIAIESGSVNTSSETGPVNIGSGATTGGISGQVAIYTGSGDTSGDIHLETGDATTRGNIRLSGLPLVDPHVADALWVDVAAGRVLKVSAG